ncbi:site-specific DNA-methyltransferase [Viridibacillus arvi]|uniref:site-specific DNA-methyltransferase n=1 Tax=Viridibacillus arvi TaxID=263475 RepID=UPI0034CF1E08
MFATNTPSIHQIAWEEIEKLGGLAPLQKIYKLVIERMKNMDIPLPRLDSIRGALVDKTTGTGRRATGDYLFERVAKGVYKVIKDGDSFCVLNESSRNLNILEDESVHAVLADHPWFEPKSHKSGNQKSFTQDYAEETFRYTIEDFKAKYRVLVDGGYLVENLPAENAENTEYLMNIRQYAKEAGFHFYALVPWIKHRVPNNTGRTQKDREYLIFWTKNKPRRLAPIGKPYFTRTMLPSEFDISAPARKQHQAEKPKELYKRIIDLITEPNDVIVEQFGGSGNSAVAALEINRHPIVYEIMEKFSKKIFNKLKLASQFKLSLNTKNTNTNYELVFGEDGQATLF